ncbi:hypothetical protein NIES4071_07530 [Calothrix sp. NIES-4071]|nr:hypothetical protein NIES4071_07530 [Calothrix sp. NIES-4071]BAZ55095.1 hypothetical protein NIES4105_07490 [Calothrix sp. NIES-4105]
MANILTWNMRGGFTTARSKWREDLSPFTGGSYDVLLLQECGALPETAQTIQNFEQAYRNVAPNIIPQTDAPIIQNIDGH